LFTLDNSDFTMGSISAANGEFCFDVFKELKAHHANDNIFYSPMTIISALAMVYLGARGDTQSQMEKVTNATYLLIFMSSPQCGTSEYIHSSFKDLISDLTRPNTKYLLKITDRLYMEKTYPILPEYLKCAKKFYKAGVEEVNFKTDTEEARQLINSWVEKETDGKAQKPGSRYFALPTIIYTHVFFSSYCPVKTGQARAGCLMLWKQNSMKQHPAPPRPSLQPQHRTCILPPSASSLKDGSKIFFGRALLISILCWHCIPCLSLQLENKISYEKLKEWTSPSMMKNKTMKVCIPRMKIEEKYNLTAVLIALGMTDLFSPSANLSGISSADNLKVSEVIHEAYMEVNEEGTEAGGSTDVMGDITYSLELEEMKADHPFLLFVKHNPTDTILFFGRYCSP
ncbi:OVALY protein, partial [Trogon melanurus]|nr:OVALY protein [Trogon melanurus]